MKRVFSVKSDFAGGAFFIQKDEGYSLPGKDNVVNLFQAAGWPGVLEMFLRLLIACICGCAIGTERSLRFKEA